MWEVCVTTQAYCEHEGCSAFGEWSSYRGTSRQQAMDDGWTLIERGEELLCWCPEHKPQTEAKDNSE